MCIAAEAQGGEEGGSKTLYAAGLADTTHVGYDLLSERGSPTT